MCKGELVVKTLWFSYSTVNGLDAPEPANSPYSITWNLGHFLCNRAAARGYGFEYRNLDAPFVETIGGDDIVIGHTWYPDGWLNHALDSAAKAKFVLQPYSENMVAPTERPWIKDLFAKADRLLLVTGPYWYDTMPGSNFAEWYDKTTRLDMAINPALHPHSKKKWGPQGKRRVLAIGTDIPAKGLDLIADFARCGGFHLGYYGNAPYERFIHVPQFKHYAGAGFTPAVQATITSEYDIFISLARSDANPTTLLETACWGLLPMCNQESGYWPNEPFVELRKDDMLFNLSQMDRLQSLPEYRLKEMADCVRREVVERHTWQRFNETVWAEIAKWL